MDFLKSFKTIDSRLKKLGTKERAINEKRYLKSEHIHYGCVFADITKTVTPFINKHEVSELYELATKLWLSNVFDNMIAATRILRHKKIPPSDKLWKTVKKFMPKAQGWALADALASPAGKCIVSHERYFIDLQKWTTAKDLWKRRAVLVFTLPYARAGVNTKPIFKIMQEYMHEDEWFIHKAIGWWLRDLSKVKPNVVIKFVNDHEMYLKTVAKKEALRKIS
jgi:3-methyladenine DNA glycosylase AlkD